jgi:hypothetical protein
MPSPRSISTLNRCSFFNSTAFGTAALALPGFTIAERESKPDHRSIVPSSPMLTSGDGFFGRRLPKKPRRCTSGASE